MNTDSYIVSKYYPCFIEEDSIRGRIHINPSILRTLFLGLYQVVFVGVTGQRIYYKC